MTIEEFIKVFEPLHLKTSIDAWDNLVIGYGHKHLVKPNMEITKEQAEELLEMDVERIRDIISEVVDVELSTNEEEALISLIHSIGPRTFYSSKLLKYLNEGNKAQAGSEIAKYNKVPGPVELMECEELVERRLYECKLFWGLL